MIEIKISDGLRRFEGRSLNDGRRLLWSWRGGGYSQFDRFRAAAGLE